MITHGTVEGTARPTGRPRSAQAEKAIIEATITLIGEGTGISELTIEAIAARAGVGKTTIYRRWSNKEDLVVDALAALKAPIPPLPGTSLRDDLIVYLTALLKEAVDPRTRCVINIALSENERHPRLAERFHEVAIEPRRRTLQAVLERGMRTGELRADLDVEIAMAALVGTFMWQTKMARTPGAIPADLPRAIVDELLTGLAPRPS